ncbi:serine hydrolase [Amycolatopsis sp. NBRC 101858]|uniref:serine hydrolase domain-containing protein n=1 Tax=Amycolatopsis sp. NBRC 101858 TaxID=3032200 RepID=UPI0024A508DC|nr:serine hydrolase domain-containing protein [Amycolatopsis sp. NBRC 101858]GLY40488.1 serine hydrolase [Amycolatopsis sp. NBRC 101858]
MTANPLFPRHRRRAGLALLVAVALSGVLTACDETPGPAGVGLAELAQRDVDAGAPGVIVRVDDGSGRVVELARQAPWTTADHVLSASDAFRMGSNTKTMVATVALQLVAEQRLRLTDPVGKWLPGLVPNGDAITVRMLLGHTSGLFNYRNDPAVLRAFTGQDTRVWTPRELLAAAVRHDPLFAPGTDYAYSNTNYVALGLVAEKATGRTLGDLVRERIVAPLHLTKTYLVEGDTSTLAHGYEPDAAHIAPLLPAGTPAGTAFAGPARPAGYVDTTFVNASTQWAAGGMVSSAPDWARFDRALVSGELLPPALLKEMQTTRAEEPEFPDRRYGLGLEQVTTPCGTVWGHNGQVAGYSGEAYTDDTGKRTASVLTTTIFGLAVPKAGAANRELVNAAVCAMLGKPVPGTAAVPAG